MSSAQNAYSVNQPGEVTRQTVMRGSRWMRELTKMTESTTRPGTTAPFWMQVGESAMGCQVQ